MSMFEYQPYDQKPYNGHELGHLQTAQQPYGSRRQSVQSLSQTSSVSFAEPLTPTDSTPSRSIDCGYFSQEQFVLSPPFASQFRPSINWSCIGGIYPQSSPSEPHPDSRSVLSTAGRRMNAFTRAATGTYSFDQELLPSYQDCCLSQGLPLVQTLGSNEPGWGQPSSLTSFSETLYDSDNAHGDEAFYEFEMDSGIDPSAILASEPSMIFNPGYIHNDHKLNLGQFKSQWDAVPQIPLQTPRLSMQVPLLQTPTSSRKRRSSKRKTRSPTPPYSVPRVEEPKHRCVVAGCDKRFVRAEHLKRHIISEHGDGQTGKRFKCALAIGGGEFTCTINNRTNSRKNPNTAGTTRQEGIPRRDNHYQHYQTHLKHKEGKSRNRIVSKDFLYFCIKKHNREDFANIKMRLEKAFSKPNWPGFAQVDDADQAWMRAHPDYKHWLDVLAGGTALPDVADVQVSTVSSWGEDDIFTERAKL